LKKSASCFELRLYCVRRQGIRPEGNFQARRCAAYADEKAGSEFTAAAGQEEPNFFFFLFFYSLPIGMERLTKAISCTRPAHMGTALVPITWVPPNEHPEGSARFLFGFQYGRGWKESRLCAWSTWVTEITT
jgi:hypothetical protein